MRWLHSWLAAMLLAVMAAAPLHAQSVLPVPALTGRVIDSTGTLSPDQVQMLEARLESIERERGSQIVVLMVPSTMPEDIAAYAQRVGDAWKIGRREVGDGLLVVVAKNDRRVRIEVAKALEGAVPDLAAAQIIDDRIKPAFRAGDYAGGLLAAIERLGERIGTEGLPEPEVVDSEARGNDFGMGPELADMAIFLFVAVPVVGSILSALMGRKLGSLVTAAGTGGVGWWLTTSVLIGGLAGFIALVVVGLMGVGTRRGLGGSPGTWGSGSSGGGGFSSSSSSGGGFSSGGGGDFGGGGASGGW